MPNGGVPRWQVIRPADSDLVFLSDFAGLRVVAAEDFNSDGVAARPIVELSEAQAFAPMNHLSYWLKSGQQRVRDRNQELSCGTTEPLDRAVIAAERHTSRGPHIKR